MVNRKPLMMKLAGVFSILCVVAASAVANAEAAVGEAIDLAPNIENTRSQMWPRTAWSESAKTWLVAWREGHTNGLNTDILCARVSANGKALDPTGIKICAAADNQERPWVASDGMGFLVVWEDFRNGKDYDVYAARVSAEGKVLDPDGFRVAGGANNQCHPTVAFAGGNYYVAWQAFSPDPGRYLLYGSRVSSDGKVLDPDGVCLTPPGGKGELIDEWANADNPVIVADGDRLLVGHTIAARGARSAKNFHSRGEHGAIVSVNAMNGKPEGKTYALGPPSKLQLGFMTAGQSLPAIAWGGDGGLFADRASRGGRHIVLWRVNQSLKETGPPRKFEIATTSGISLFFDIAFDGETYLMTQDYTVGQRKSGRKLNVFGLLIPAKGDLPENLNEKTFTQTAFSISGDPGKNQMQGEVCAGSKGTFLVTYVEVRARDSLVLVSRTVKSE